MKEEWEVTDYRPGTDGEIRSPDKHGIQKFQNYHAEMNEGVRGWSSGYLKRLQPLAAPVQIPEAGGAIYCGDISYGKIMVPMWRVTLYRLALN